MTFLNKIYFGDCIETMRSWPGGFVQTCVTSPPYWGLRDYGVEGQLGLEKTPDEYVAKMVAVFREVKRVLRDDGTMWLNLGDSYEREGGRTSGVKAKDLVGIPWRVAFALQADGWYLRQDIIWAKPNPMPESVTDRCTKSHEYIFMLTKSARYYYDADAIKEPAIYYEIDSRPSALERGRMYDYDSKEKALGRVAVYKDAKSFDGKHSDKQRGHGRRHAGFNDRWDAMEKTEQCGAMRNKRDVWTVATRPFSGAHFATFPPKLIEPCILAGSATGDTVLDPFMGSGTTAMVAQSLGRNYIGCELNREYEAMQADRTKQLGMAL